MALEHLGVSMATALITVEEYLRTSYEPDAEYIDGVIEERPMGEGKHSAWQMTIGAFFFMRSREWHIRVRPELRTQTGTRRYRIPDLAIITPEAADQPIATVAPLIAIEILSPEDRIATLLVRLADFESMGIPAIYVVDSEDGSLFRFQSGKLGAAASISVRDREVSWSEIAETLC